MATNPIPHPWDIIDDFLIICKTPKEGRIFNREVICQTYSTIRAKQISKLPDLIAKLNNLIVAVEIIDGDKTPTADDYKYLYRTIDSSRKLLQEIKNA